MTTREPLDPWHNLLEIAEAWQTETYAAILQSIATHGPDHETTGTAYLQWATACDHYETAEREYLTWARVERDRSKGIHRIVPRDSGWPSAPWRGI